jgi:hypothetical protein
MSHLKHRTTAIYGMSRFFVEIDQSGKTRKVVAEFLPGGWQG